MSGQYQFDPPQGSLRASVGRGAAAIAASQAVMVATQMGSVIILSRLLAPEEFGLVAMCAPVLALIGMLQDFGLVQATVQKPNLRHDEVNFLFWVNVALSVALALLLLLISPLVALFYQEPRIGPLIAAMAVIVAANGLGAQHSALLNRRMEYGRIAIIGVVGAVAGLATATVWALVQPTYWALFGGQLAGTLLPAGLMWIASRWRPGMPRGAEGGRALIGFGAGITGFNFANFFARNLDNVLIGRVWGGAQLGLYDRAYKLLLMPLNQVANPLSKVMIPALSRMLDEPGRYRSAYLRVLTLSLLLVLPGVAAATALAGLLIPFALGEQWAGSAPIFMALGFAGLLQPLNNPAGWLFISQGRSTEFMYWGFATAAFAVVAFVLGLPYGALGVAVAYAISEYIKTPVLWLYIGRRGAVRAGDVARTCAPLVVAAHAALGLVWLARPWLSEGRVEALLQGAALAYLATILLIAPFPTGRDVLREAWLLIRGGLTRLRGLTIRRATSG
ncbi:lipopolysaccharide biosynthesis protein (plasmid) [Cereibacter azotoformans]|uniref:lipopolysaccharide biosynthesis protein n=1 Tax=Cereibacter azotoformans TaxID=43057 RepID=UPI003B227A65